MAIRMVYGYKVDSPDDKLVRAAEELMAIFADSACPGTIGPYLVPGTNLELQLCRLGGGW